METTQISRSYMKISKLDRWEHDETFGEQILANIFYWLAYGNKGAIHQNIMWAIDCLTTNTDKSLPLNKGFLINKIIEYMTLLGGK